MAKLLTYDGQVIDPTAYIYVERKNISERKKSKMEGGREGGREREREREREIYIYML